MDPRILPDCFNTGLCSGFNELGKTNVANLANAERLERGVKEILDYLEQGRTGDAMFTCEALLCR